MTAKITLRNETRARIEGEFPAKALDEHFSFEKSRFWWRSRMARMGLWDGKTHLFDRFSGTLPMGLVNDARKWFREHDIAYKIVDERKSRPLVVKQIVTKLGGGITLRPDQALAVEKAVKRERGIIWGATGAGKTELAVAIIESFNRPITLFLTGRKKLARQTRERFALRFGVDVKDIGFIQGGEWQVGTTGVYVAVIGTLTQQKFARQRQQLNNTCELLIIDEAHHSGSHSYYNLVMNCKARYRYGLTGTPVGRSDSADLYLRACTGNVVARISADALIKKGILARPKIYFTEVNRPTDMKVAGRPWAHIYKESVVENTYRNKLILKYAGELQRLGKKTLILVREIEHGRLLEESLVDTVFLHGGFNDEYIDESVRDFERGEFSTIIATSIFDEGIDLPVINALILAAGGKSSITTLQRIGRGLRRKKLDNRLFVFDFYDKMNSYMEKHAKNRVAICEKEKFPVEILERPGSVKKLVA